jgi:predicted nucleic acid-binding protein
MVNNMHRALVLDNLPAISSSIEIHDPNDTFLLAMAQASNADYLVTGDRRAGLLQLSSFGRTSIVTPSVFCAKAFLTTIG